MEKEKFPKQKPHTSFNRRQSVAKNPEGEHDNGQEKYLKFYFTGGNMTKGEYGKGYYGNLINLKNTVVDTKIEPQTKKLVLKSCP